MKAGLSQAGGLKYPPVFGRTISTIKDLNTIPVGPDQQKVFYTVSSEDGKTQQYMMLCPKDIDQNTLITFLVRTISADPTNKGKKTIRITQQKSSPGGMSLLLMPIRIHLVFL